MWALCDSLYRDIMLLTFDKLNYYDPESNADGETYPLIKVVNFGLKVGF